jgi:hypothetical protein
MKRAKGSLKKGVGEKGVGAERMVAGPGDRSGGKSELHRAGWSLTATGGNPKESATEKIPPLRF